MSETQALLQHDDSPTAILSKKLRTLMQYNALQEGYLPATTQLQEHVAGIAQSPVLNSKQRGLSRQTKRVVEDAKAFLKATNALLKDKNEDDIVQEIIWNLRGASAESEIDGDLFSGRLDAASAKADAKTAHLKAKAIADVLYSNPQFRALIHDGSMLARDVLSDVVEATATAIAPEENDLIELEEEATDVDGRAIKDDVEDTKRDLKEGIDSAKTQIKNTYDQATNTAIETLSDLQKQGQRFGEQMEADTTKALSQAKAKANELADRGQQKAAALSESAKSTMNDALAKIEEISGLTQGDIRKKLDEGISVEEIINMAKAGAQKADLKAGKMLTQAKTATKDFAERNNLEGRAQDVVEQGKELAADASEKGQQAGQQATKVAQNTAADVKPKIDAGIADAKTGAAKLQEKSQDVAKDVATQAEGAKNAARDEGQDVKRQLETSASGATSRLSTTADAADGSTSNSPSHLRQIGIIHTDEPQGSQMQDKGLVHPDPKYTFDDDTVKSEPQSNSSQKERLEIGSELVQQVIAQIREKVKDIQGISQGDLEAAAKDLIKKTTESAEGLEEQARTGAEKAKDSTSQLVDDAKNKAATAQEKGAAVTEKAKGEVAEKADSLQASGAERLKDAGQKASGVADKTQEKASSVKDTAVAKGREALESSQATANDVSKRLQNISQQDLQDAINNLLRSAKQKLEQSTGVKADDARQSLDWAIKKGEELAEKTLQQGRQGVQNAKDNSAEAASMIKDKSIEAGRAVEDTAVTLGAQTKHALQNAPRDAAGQIHETFDASQELVSSAVESVKESTAEISQYLSQKFPPKRRAALRRHFQGLAVSLRDNTDYSNGLDGLISIARKYIDYTLTFTEVIPSEASDVVSTNQELDKAVRLTLTLIERFSNGVGFSGVQKSYSKLKKDMKKDNGSEDFFHDCMVYFKRIVQDLKYAASEDAEKHGQQLLARIDGFAEDTGFKEDVTTLVREVVRLTEGFTSDRMLLNFYQRGQTLVKHLIMNEHGNFVFKKRVMKDFFSIIMPSALKLIQYIPISRVEFQNAEIDFLIENLVFESSGNHDQSFLPHRLKIDNHNSLEFLNAYKFESDYSNKVTVKIQGLTMAVRDAGFYIRKKTGFWRFTDSGLVDLVMDGQGIDIDIDLQMSTDEEEEDITKDALFIVKDVRVKVHSLDFSTSGTRHGWLVGLVKPFIKGFIKRQVGLAVGQAIKEQLVFYEYQLRMFQHRIKTAYIANNGQASFESFFRAIFTANAGNNSGRKGQFEVSVGKPGPLAGIFTKASLQQELEDSEIVAAEHGRSHSWRNDIFDLGV